MGSLATPDITDVELEATKPSKSSETLTVTADDRQKQRPTRQFDYRNDSLAISDTTRMNPQHGAYLAVLEVICAPAAFSKFVENTFCETATFSKPRDPVGVDGNSRRRQGTRALPATASRPGGSTSPIPPTPTGTRPPSNELRANAKGKERAGSVTDAQLSLGLFEQELNLHHIREDQEARISSIEKHLEAERQLTWNARGGGMAHGMYYFWDMSLRPTPCFSADHSKD
ncbi:hypothetical protein F5Y18DRAFT_439539 [Xylariaceae sp. FL1019]|nr:hypothetical protein F5Y18DRAFT_439539 [Xylariaceae sp. FL1019]